MMFFGGILADQIEAIVAKFSDAEKASIQEKLKKGKPGRIPAELDRRTLAKIRDKLQRDLSFDERRAYRQVFYEKLTR